MLQHNAISFVLSTNGHMSYGRSGNAGKSVSLPSATGEIEMGHTHLFEFMDLTWLPSGLHATLREILECGNARPLRPYYEWVANEVKPELAASGCHTVVELGAGSAPITRLLARDRNLDGVQLIVCDLQPDTATYANRKRNFVDS